eukprot:TRINITY_DN3385_c0_g1_i3.p1 TRINITY_DN3385_c0_g1~~TRINITY_DN3385_c0_g1_i3.p1  ORF type:complete len:172 (+),score=26.83 TRINITY_DN3385_c0_g1_i3:39-554(+)
MLCVFWCCVQFYKFCFFLWFFFFFFFFFFFPPVQANILNAVISNYNNDRTNTKAIYFKGAVNLFVDNSHITDYDNSIYLKNNYNCNVEAKVEHTEIYQTEARRGNFKGIDFTGKISAIINSNVVKSCDPAVSISGSNSVSDINRNLIFITCLLYTSPSPRDLSTSRMPSSA